MNTHTPKWTPILGVGVPMDSWIFKRRLQGSKPIGLKSFLYYWNILKRKCLKWSRMTHLDIWNTSCGQKKVGNRPNLLVFRWRATYLWKVINEGYNFASDLISIRGLHTKLWGLKIVGVPTLGISGLPFGSPMTKCHLDVGLVER
jgi:hypothetical protein